MDTYIDVRPGSPGSDSESTYYFVGVEWDLSARTSGRIDYGWHEKQFDDPLIEGYDGDFWRASIEWRPRTYSAFTLSTTRATEETVGYGDYILRDDISLDWTHQWATRFSTTAEIGWGNEEHRPGLRDEDLFWWGISGRWHLNQYLQLGAGWQHYERESAERQFNYDRNVWIITLEGSL